MPIRGIHPHLNKCGSVYVAPMAPMMGILEWQRGAETTGNPQP